MLSDRNRMKYKLHLILLVIFLLGGCSSSRPALFVSPTGGFAPQSEAELLAELNSQLPFTISEKKFFSKETSSGVSGWAVVRNDKQKDVMKDRLKKCATLKLLQVESVTPNEQGIMKTHFK
jgi:hypothetical protein